MFVVRMLILVAISQAVPTDYIHSGYQSISFANHPSIPTNHIYASGPISFPTGPALFASPSAPLLPSSLQSFEPIQHASYAHNIQTTSYNLQPVQPFYIEDTPEVKQAKAEFMAAFKQAVDGLLYTLAPEPVRNQYLEDTPEVASAKLEFFETFERAMNGFLSELGPLAVQEEYLEDTPEVAAAKQDFFRVFEASLNGMITTIENYYLDDTPEVQEAKAQFNAAYEDAAAGRHAALAPVQGGNQYLEDTPEVKAAKAEFFKLFEDALNGLLINLAPKPVQNYYIPDTPEVAQARADFEQVFAAAENGDIASALVIYALDDAISKNKGDIDGATAAFKENTNLIAEAVEVSGGDLESYQAVPAVPLETEENIEGLDIEENVEGSDIEENDEEEYSYE